MGIRDELAAQGYFELPPTISPALIARARADVDRHAEAVDAFEDDAMWEILDAVTPVAREALAAEVAILPAWWAWRVGPGDRGWPPHRDAPTRARDEAGALAGITIWVPLTDATTRNGCMYCVPSHWDYEYANRDARAVISSEQHVRALPAAAGSVLGWSHALLHWGGACGPGAPPRISTSFELIRADLAPHVPRTYPAGWRPRADERAALLAEMRAQYHHMVTS